MKMAESEDAGRLAHEHPAHVRRHRMGEAAMQRQPAKIVPFTNKRRELRVRLTSTGEAIRTLPALRGRGNDDGPRAA